ncbi:MAG: hypothetical protein LBH71_03655, partial [Oscillospiraceae bacterium]|nr:hypothetical protein [Oscillospiraceae bacterium]
MSDDILFKNSLLGFKREDVISYIEEIKNEAENAKNSIKDNESELSNALDKIDVLQEQIKIKDQLIEKLEVENEDLKAKKNLQNNEKAA